SSMNAASNMVFETYSPVNPQPVLSVVDSGQRPVSRPAQRPVATCPPDQRKQQPLFSSSIAVTKKSEVFIVRLKQKVPKGSGSMVGGLIRMVR
ncbi:MAG TPA: hypothetical protein VMO20_07055, partial [Candidatus Acidoferrum sp.]|nr:hypothetical protein [Candidatus Acidoferrum sp.]